MDPSSLVDLGRSETGRGAAFKGELERDTALAGGRESANLPN